MALASANKIGLEICRILNIPEDKVTDIDIKLHVGEVATVVVTRLIHNDEFEEMKRVLDEYELKEKTK